MTPTPGGLRCWFRSFLSDVRAWALLTIAVLVASCTSLPIVSDRPWLMPVPAAVAAADKPMVLWISGDGGWGKMEREATRRFAAAGVPTLGVDSLRYFSRRRDTVAAAHEIAAAAERQAALWGRTRIVVVGFSFGADMAPFIVRDLPPQTRARVTLAAFLSPSERANLKVGPPSWLSIGLGPETWPVITGLRPTPVLCIGNAGVFSDVCPDGATPDGITSVRLKGGHTLNNQYDTIVALILEHADS